MTLPIDVIQMDSAETWNRYVDNNPMATPYHIFHWSVVINSAYGHRGYPLAAVRRRSDGGFDLKGIFPLVQMNSFFFGNRLVSMPYFDHGGILADDIDAETALIRSALSLAYTLKVGHLELRHMQKLSCLPVHNEQQGYTELPFCLEDESLKPKWTVKTHKVRMLLTLPDSSETLLKGFKSKLRSQIKRPQKAGFTDKVGGSELLDDFYHVFSQNMRDLGSPVHAVTLFQNTFKHFPDNTRIVMVYDQDEPIAASIIFRFKNLIVNPWASALRKYRKHSPNMMLYFRMLAYAADNGYHFFDFGRSTSGEGTYRFKTQWGAQPHPMYWYTFRLKDKGAARDDSPSGKNREIVEKIWQRLPEPVARLLGPKIRKHIEL